MSPWPLPVVRALTLLALASSVARAQSSPAQPDALAEITRAPTLYYAPRGLESFQCTVTPDWDGIAKQFGGVRTLADQSGMQFMKSIRLTAQDNLKQGGSLDWSIPDNSIPPPELMGQMPSLRRGLDQAFQTVFGLWNAVVTGDIFSQPGDASSVTPEGTGWHTHEADSSQSIDETFDKDLFLLSMKTVDSNGTRVVKPQFAETPEGRIITSVELNMTPHGSTTTRGGKMAFGYSIVDGFRLPSSVSVSSAGIFVQFTMSNCTAVRERHSATPSAP